jgi:hypothetical protein
LVERSSFTEPVHGIANLELRLRQGASSSDN